MWFKKKNKNLIISPSASTFLAICIKINFIQPAPFHISAKAQANSTISSYLLTHFVHDKPDSLMWYQRVGPGWPKRENMERLDIYLKHLVTLHHIKESCVRVRLFSLAVTFLQTFFLVKNWGFCGKVETSSHKGNVITRVKREVLALKAAHVVFN